MIGIPRTLFLLLAGATVLTAPPGQADELHLQQVVPVFAYQITGVGSSLWSSDVFITNPGEETALVRIDGFYHGELVAPEPCAPPSGIPREVPPLTTIVWPGDDIAVELGCAQEVIGALRFASDLPVVITSRVVNEHYDKRGAAGLLAGFGQDVPSVSIAAGEPLVSEYRYLLPGLVWHPVGCSGVLFESNVGLVNLSDRPVSVRLDVSNQELVRPVAFGGEQQTLPVTLQLEAMSWQQLSFRPWLGTEAPCLPTELIDLLIEADGPLALYGSVVDRSSQDGRTVLPLTLAD